MAKTQEFLTDNVFLPIRERKLNTKCFFSNFSGTSGISRQNPGISRQKSLISLVSRGMPNFSAPPVHVEGPCPNGKYPDSKSLGLGSFFLPDWQCPPPPPPPKKNANSIYVVISPSLTGTGGQKGASLEGL